ncbi:hypothetical protein [Campylobacter sp. 19-13652]|uniref:hypothetical protein n=1 Tax=Campylobacter sp. 19-13652 TaxID=2840180 RepID=UPI001C780C06|nr:hypothetical protein [Campylobacter sp. 19-13652]BCX79638.1 hypothetical protein LBC_11000 [Campylobacter sp. 19-13652]
MKIAKIVTILLVLLIVAIYSLAFTNYANSILASYASKIIKEKSGLEVRFDKFKLRPNNLDIKATANNEIEFDIQGKLELLKLGFDLDYSISANNLKSLGLSLKDKVNISGKALGSAKNFSVNGSGRALGSNLSFLTNLKDFKLNTLKLDARGARIEDALAMMLKPAYLSGKVDLLADINENSQQKPSGPASIKINQAIANNALIKSDFGIDLPQNFIITGIINARLDGALVSAKTALNTPVATINAQNTLYDLDQKLLNTDLEVKIDELLRLEPIIKQKLNGKVELNANVGLKNGQLSQLNAKLDGLGGSVIASLNADVLNAKIENIDIQKALALAAKPPLAKGKINGVAQLKGIISKNISGRVFAKSEAGVLNAAELNKLGTNLLKDISFNADVDASLSDNVADFSANIISGLLNLQNLKGRYDLRAKALKATFGLTSADASEFKSALNATLSSPINLNGEIITNDTGLVSLKTAGVALGGDIQSKFDGKNASLKASALHIRDLFLLAGKQPILDALLDAKADIKGFDTHSLNGDASLNLKNAKMSAKEIEKLTGKKPDEDLIFEANIDSKIDAQTAKFEGKIGSNLANINGLKASYDLKNSEYESEFDVISDNLSKLAFLTGRKLNGAIKAHVNAQGKGADIKAQISSKIFDGDLSATLNGDKFDAKISDFKVQEMLKMVDLQPFYEGLSNGTFTYNLKNQQGDFNFVLSKGQLKNTKLVQFVSTISTKDLSKEVFNDGKFTGNLNKNIIDFKANLASESTNAVVEKGTFNTTNKVINIPLNLKIQKTDLSVKITGTSDEPKYSINSDYLKQKAAKAIDKLLDKSLKDDSKSDVKELLKGLFN